MSRLLAAHVAATWAMVGLIWFVQVVHYPLFRHVGPAASVGYQARHMRWTTWVVAPLMLVEAATGIWLVAEPPADAAPWMPLAGLGLLLVVWVATLLVQVPQHQRLTHGFDALAHRRLVSTNWLRTLCWTARGLLVLAMGMAPPPR